MRYAELLGTELADLWDKKPAERTCLGKEKMIDLLESRIGNAERTMQNNISNDCYSNGRFHYAVAA